jgi:hypothetical protein
MELLRALEALLSEGRYRIPGEVKSEGQFRQPEPLPDNYFSHLGLYQAT